MPLLVSFDLLDRVLLLIHRDIIIVPTYLSILDECKTVSGPSANKPCRFPFHYQNVTYNTCTMRQADDNKPWCSTLVDDNNNHVPGGGHYGDCGPKCPLPGR